MKQTFILLLSSPRAAKLLVGAPGCIFATTKFSRVYANASAANCLYGTLLWQRFDIRAETNSANGLISFEFN